MIKRFMVLFLLLMVVGASARVYRTPKVDNSRVAREDVVYVDSLDVVYSPIFWQADGGVKALLLEANDDSSAGFASDSAVVKVELMQVFDDGYGSVYIMPSHAHPDSTTYPYSSDFILYTSLNISDMDTLSYWDREAIADLNLNGDTTGYYYNDTLSAVATSPGAVSYTPIVPDYSPGLVLKITGLAGNKITGSGSRWTIRWYQETGTAVFNK